MKDEINSKNSSKKRDDTLDYYNDSLPKKAVESLFDKKERSSGSERSFVKGYDSDDEDDFEVEDDFEEDYKNEFEEEPEADFIDKPVKKYTRETINEPVKKSAREITSTEDYADSYDYDFIDEGTKKIKRVVIPEKASYKEKSMHIPDSEDSLEEHLALYSKSSVKKSSRDLYDYDEKPAHSGEELRSSRIDNEIRRSRADDDTRRPRAEGMYKERAHAEEGARSTRADDPAKRRLEEDARRRTQYANAAKTRGALSHSYDDEEDDDDNNSSSPVKSVIIGVLVVVVLAVFTALILKINNLNGAYTEAAAKIESYDNTEKALQQALIDNESLESKITMLEEVIEQYKTALPQFADPETNDNSANGNSGTDNGSSTTQGSSTGNPTTYTVVAGDNLSKISIKFYGTGSEYKKIMEANNLQNESITIGQVLIIP